MSGNNIKRYTLDEIREMKGETDWDSVHQQGDHDGPQEIEVDWTKVRMVEPAPKRAVSVRIDEDVLDFFKSQGKGYQTRMNAVLRAYMDAKKSGQA